MNHQKDVRRPGRCRLMFQATAALTMVVGVPVMAAEINTGDPDWAVRWDNTVKYSAAVRVGAQDPYLMNPVGALELNTQSGDRNFKQGSLISNRGDLLSEFDAAFQRDTGLHVSAAAWYDTVYANGHTDNTYPRSIQMETPADRFTSSAKTLSGKDLELLDAFVYKSFDVGGHPVSLRLGRHTLLWGESLFFSGNGIAAGQAPIDVNKALSTPGVQAKEVFMPLGQVSATVGLVHNLSLMFYNQIEARQDRLPPPGTYFSSADFIGPGAQFWHLAPILDFLNNGPLLRLKDDAPKNGLNNRGIALKYTADALNTDFGLYATQYTDFGPVPYFVTNPHLPFPAPGYYALGYHQGVHAYGASASTTVGDANVAAEVSVRTHTNLASVGTLQTSRISNGSTPPGTVGDTVHAQISEIWVLPRTAIWDQASWVSEIAGNKLLGITQNESAFDFTTTHYGLGLRTEFDQTWFQVAPRLDLTASVNLGFTPLARGASLGAPMGNNHGGDVTFGLQGDFDHVWRGKLAYTHYYGNNSANKNALIPNGLIDRDFVSFYVQRSF